MKNRWVLQTFPKADDQQAEWTRDTLVNVWSTTKGVTAICVAMLVDRGQISFDTPLAEFWPAFAEGAKRKITLSMLMSHQAGLCGFREPVSVDYLFDLQKAANHLAEMEPFWTPGEGHGYHALTIGLLVSELFTRVDGRTLKTFVSEELYGAYGLDIHIGLPVSMSMRSSDVIAPLDLSTQAYATEFTDAQIAALMNPMMSPEVANTAAWKAADIPSANSFATAEALAFIYGALATDGMLAGKKLLGEQALMDSIAPQTRRAVDKVMSLEAQWANGFLLNTMHLYGPDQSAFGHSGWGGSFAFADRNKGIGCAYTMNKMGADLIGDPRAVSLVNALYQDLESLNN
ncbi:serine hydrolase [Pseudomonas sp. ANT_J28]|uniref:serine hydrolase domain-containing protein n=1 Tax=Pseudomonas sp. ANT_J28 TaxID=2597352 RepID=UPI0011F38BE8|nr:serine hydrolase domain-containing protein [Pseudomonas sp. ANT_J28]KAA0973527.1 beta-lactamase family protein [Pseudomonas sp. ANT_J28]